MFQKNESKNRIIKTEVPFDVKNFSIKLKEMKEKQEKIEYKLKHPREFLQKSPYKKFKEKKKKSTAKKLKLKQPQKR